MADRQSNPHRPEDDTVDVNGDEDSSETLNGVPVEDTAEPLDWLVEGEVVAPSH